VASVVVLTGPAGAGKNTVAVELTKQLDHLAVIDGDDVRQMVRQPHKAPWEGEAGATQHELGVQNNCSLARSFVKAGYDVLILDVVSQNLVSTYRRELSSFPCFIVSLLPSREVIRARNQQKPSYLQPQEIEWTYQKQEQLTDFDERIDNSSLGASNIAERIRGLVRK
jgi:tRNA uridine 5-carbamoylmethylation protein Kti12